MNKLNITIGVTAVAIFVQLALGGLLTFDLISPAPHIAVGALVLAMAIVLMVVLFRMGTEYRRLRNMSIALVGIVLVQAFIGIETLETGYSWLAWLHLLVALMIYGMIVSASFIATIILRNSKIPDKTKVT